MSELRVLDLFAGLGGASSAFRERGHRVVTVDREDRFDPTVCADVFTLTVDDLARYGPFDFVWASPPCTCFSVMTISNYWTEDGDPKPPAQEALALVGHTIDLIEDLDPAAWILENPVGMLRVQDPVQPFERRTVTYCQYGLPYRKATDLFGRFPPNLSLEPACKPNARCHQPAPRSTSKHFNGRKNGHDPIRDVFSDVNDRRGGRGPYDSDPPPERVEKPLVEPSEQEIRQAWTDVNLGKCAGSDWDGDAAALRALVPYELSVAVCRAVEAMVDEGWSWRDGTLEAYGVEVES